MNKKNAVAIFLVIIMVFVVTQFMSGCSTGSTSNSTAQIAESPSPSITPTPEMPAEGKRIVGYYTSWSIYDRNYKVTDIPADRLTHIIYAFFKIDSLTGKVKMTDPWADVEIVFTGDEGKGFPDQTWDQSAQGKAGNLGRLRQLKAVYPDVKTLMSIGGWTLSYNFTQVASSKSAREIFAASCVEIMRQQGFDGIDIDWEFPGPSDKNNFTLLLQELRTQLDAAGDADGKHYLLTIAGPPGRAHLANIDLEAVSNQVDFINVMAYDFHGGWDKITNHQSALYENPNDPTDPASKAILNVSWLMNYYVNAGVPASKLNMGVPFYGRAWEEVPSKDNGLFQPGPSLPDTKQPGNWEEGNLDYWKVIELLNTTDYNVFWDDNAKASWLYGKNLTSGKTSGGMFVTFDDVRTVTEKAKYVKNKGIGGLMIWELSGDVRNDDSQSLLKAIYQELNQ